MPPYQFQDLVAALLRAMGYHVPWVAPPGKDGGTDIVAYTDPLGATGPRIKVQVKRHNTGKIGVGDLRSFLAVVGSQDVSLLPADYVPQPGPLDVARCNSGLYSDNIDFENTCSANGGVAEWLAREGVCRDGFIVVMSHDASCDGHGGFVSLNVDGQTTTVVAPSTAAAPVATSSIVFPIEVGSVGPAVAAVQARVGASADCDFGNQTRQAVEAWQRDHERPVTGSIDVWDWALLGSTRPLG